MSECRYQPMYHPYDAIAAQLSSLRKATFGSLSWLGVGLEISRSLVQLPAGALWSVLGQESLLHIASVHPAEKCGPCIDKAVIRACALDAASSSGISLEGLKWFPCVQCLLAEEGRVNILVDTRL